MKPFAEINDAVGASTGEITTTTIDSECYNQVLILLNVGVNQENRRFIAFSGTPKTKLFKPTELGPSEKAKLTIDGTADIFGRSLPTTITLTDRQEGQRAFRVCVIDVGTADTPFGQCRPEDFEKKLGFKLDNFVGPTVRDKTFEVKTFQARSDTLQLKISGELKAEEASETVEILKKPPVKLTPTGFTLETFLFSDWTVPDVRFEVSGTFEFTPGNIANATVSLPVGKTGTPGLYRAMLSKSAIGLSTVSTLTGVEVKDLFAEAPTELTNTFSFGLQSLTIDFYRPAIVGVIRVIISVMDNKPWTIVGGLQLGNVALHLEILQPLQPESRLIYLFVTGKLMLGGVALDAAASFAVGGRNGQISFSTLSGFPLSKLLSLPGGNVLELLELPYELSSVQVKLNELSIGFSLSAPSNQKLQSLRLDVSTNLQWNLIPGCFQSRIRVCSSM